MDLLRMTAQCRSSLARLAIRSLLVLTPVCVYAAPDGAALYETHCAACHQVGGGGIGLPLAASKLATVPDEYLEATIRHGRSGRIMPAFPELSAAQVDAIIGYVRSWSGVAGPAYDPTPIAGDPARGERLYRQYCIACHAEDGSGAGLGTGVTYSRDRAFAVMPPAIANPGFLASATDQMIKRVIMLGRPGSDMKSYLDVGLRDEDFNDLVSYIRGFERRNAANRDDAGAASEPAAWRATSPYDFATTVDNVKQAINGSNFRYFPDRLLEQGLADEGAVNPRQMTIRFCNFNQLYKMMRIEPRFGVGLPCRITVLETADGSVEVVAMNLRVLAELFNNDELLELLVHYNTEITDIIEEATL